MLKVEAELQVIQQNQLELELVFLSSINETQMLQEDIDNGTQKKLEFLFQQEALENELEQFQNLYGSDTLAQVKLNENPDQSQIEWTEEQFYYLIIKKQQTALLTDLIREL